MTCLRKVCDRLAMVNLPPHEQEHAVWSYLSRVLDALADTAPATQREIDHLALEHGMVRLTGLVHALTQDHQIDKRGRCKVCRRDKRTPHRSGPCAVLPVASLYLTEPLSIVWWQIFLRQGRNLAHEEVESWLER
jgi:hypothetical protein